MTALQKQGERAKAAAQILATAGTAAKNKGLTAIAAALETHGGEILAANGEDIRQAKAAGMTVSLLDRLTLTTGRISQMVDGIRQVAALKDPVGEVIDMSVLQSGLTVGRRRVPLGVIALIYEARPNVTVDAAVLCLKAGNAVILRGGKEAFHSNSALCDVMRGALAESGLPENAVSLVTDTSRDSAKELMGLTGYVDVLIPRGGAGLIRSVVDNARVPVIETGTGNCHIYVDREADLDMGAEIIYNAKCSRPSVCNAAETLLVAENIAADFLPMAKKLLDRKNTRLLGDEAARRILGPETEPVTDEDYYTEFGDYVLAIKVVKDAGEAIAHINKYGSGHSEAIVTENYSTTQRFLNEVDAAAVYVNASTRFTDGFEFGLGAEIGISTQKMHARGPMGLRELTSSKFVIYGNGQIR